MLVWMDLEMTGLDHTSDVIVEIATIVTDDELNDRRRGPRPRDPPTRRGAGADGPVRRRHAHPVGSARRDQGVDDHARRGRAATLEFIKQHVPEPVTVPLCGNSIGTDRRFLAAYLPDIENYLHYRSIDVSSVKELVQALVSRRVDASGRTARVAPCARRHPRVDPRDGLLPRARLRRPAPTRARAAARRLGATTPPIEPSAIIAAG